MKQIDDIIDWLRSGIIWLQDQNVELLVILQHEFKLRTVLKIAEVRERLGTGLIQSYWRWSNPFSFQMYKVASIARITEMAKLESLEETNEVMFDEEEWGEMMATNR